LNEVEEFIKN